LAPAEEAYRALVLGVHDYVTKTGFDKVVIGLSGGVDSSLVAVIAADALGKGNVVGAFMPSQFTSAMSGEDARALAQTLGIRLLTLPITDLYKDYLALLAETFKGRAPGTAEENIQSRIRGNLLMALSNKFGWLVLTTGNKSEMSTGYATLYGDMAGGFSVIKDVPKTLVYELARWRNARDGRPVIPDRVLKRPPTAELRANQKDTDTLPPYDLLDPIIQAYVEEDRTIEDIVALGFPRQTVDRVVRMIDANEYKRRQAPIGIKITSRAFGRDRRMPVTNQYEEARINESKKPGPR
jgi:NAD+ synthase (glutamine-hydrolysing)